MTFLFWKDNFLFQVLHWNLTIPIHPIQAQAQVHTTGIFPPLLPSPQLLTYTPMSVNHSLVAQMVGIDTLEWIVEAKTHCTVFGRSHGWHWLVDKEVDLDHFHV